MTSLYTMGIGLYKGPHKKRKADFKTRVERLTEQFGTIQIVDIRRYACGSRNGKWCYHPGDQNEGMRATLDMPSVTYHTLPALSKPLSFGNTQVELVRYKDWLHERVKQHPAVTAEFIAIQRVKYLYETCPAVVLMCSEKAALKGKTIKCHRVVVGSLISDRTGCDVIHLPGDNNEATKG